MSGSTLYDEDILLWSEQQAAAIRQLGRTRRDLPNELDVENVAEEIEGAGRSELAPVKSYLRLILLHLMKLIAEPDSSAGAHWRGEIVGLHSEMMSRYAPSMRQRIDLDDLWDSAREQALLAYEGAQQRRIAALASRCPFEPDDLIAGRIDPLALLKHLQP
jgi:hypothetical protein